MQQGSKELAEYLFEDGLPKCKEDIIKKISADFEDLDPKIQEHLEAWAVILVAHLTKNYK